MTYDLIVAGAGIVGLATAYRLLEARPNLKIALLEKEKLVAHHQTGHNSGVIHSGIYYRPESLRARQCLKGYHDLIHFCESHDIPYDRCGKVIVATQEEERKQLDQIYQRGLQNGLKGIKKIGPEATKEIEPHVNVVEAIWVPQSGIVDYAAVARKYAELIQISGAELFMEHAVKDVKAEKGQVWVETSKGNFQCGLFINCTGLYSDKIAKMSMPDIDLQIIPFRGEYYELIPEKQYLVNNLIYPVPNPNFPFLGVHFTRMIKGGIEAGPNAVLAFAREGYSRWQMNRQELAETLRYRGFRKIAARYWATGLGELHRSFSKRAFVRALRHLISDIELSDLKRGGAGVRAMACLPDGSLSDEFLLYEKKGIINVCNAPSPAATASLAVGETIASHALKQL